MPISRVRQRIYADFMMPSRLDEYRSILGRFVERGYQFLSVAEYARRLTTGALEPEAKFAVLRQDVDTDVGTARAMWRIERELGAQASRYFRLSTLDYAFMREIDREGGEASYHYEEVSTFIRRHRIKTRRAVIDRLAEVVPAFEKNLSRLRDETGLAMTTVASHGDFTNRRLGVFNYELLADRSLRKRLCIAHEVYDADLEQPIDARFCDRPVPACWQPHDPRVAAESGARIVYLLIHPRHWRVNVASNLRDGVDRVWAGIRHAV